MRQLDETDRALAAALTADARQTVRSLARGVGLSEPAVRDRVLRLERDGVVRGYHADLAPEAADAGTAAFVSLRFAPEKKDRMDDALRAEACVVEVHEVAGEDCYWLKVRVSSTAALSELLDRLRAIEYVHGTSTTVVLRTIFERPLGISGPEEPS